MSPPPAETRTHVGGFCNGCTACCKGERIHLMDGDDPSAFETVAWGGKLWLKHVDGECVYLTDNGCAIYDRQPRMCRSFNCVEYFRMMNRNRRRALIKANPAHFKSIFKAARARGA